MSWISPTGFEDPDSKWDNEPNAYDENTDTNAISTEALFYAWTKFIILTISAIQCDKVRFNCEYASGTIQKIDLDVYKDGVWVDVYEGDCGPNHTWVEKTFTQGSVSQVRMRFYSVTSGARAKVWEFDFWEISGAIEKSFSDVGGGSDGFVNPYRAMGFNEVGAGAEVFGIPFKALPFSDVGHGAEAFNTPFKAMGFSDVCSGLDAFKVLLFKAFTDAGLGSDAFTKELIGFLEKAFTDSGLGTDSFLIPFKAMQFFDSGLGTDVFTIPFKALIFVDTGTGTDVFVIPFKTMSFSDVASGTDVFFLLQEKTFSDVGGGTDAFSKTILEIISKAFADAGLGSDAFDKKRILKLKLPFLIGMTLDGQLVWIFKQEYDIEE